MRIIAGAFKGKPLHSPEGIGTRPPLDRVKLAIFAILGELPALPVLDLFAGVGSFGLEALSRGAPRAVFVESSPAVVEILERNIRALGVRGRTRVVRTDLAGRLPDEVAREGPFGLIFADPPYALLTGASRAAVRDLLADAARALAPAGRLILHGPPEIEPLDVPGLALVTGRRYGRSEVWVFGRSGE